MPDTCPACNTSLPADAVYCPECGTGLGTAESSSDGRTLAAITHIVAFLTWIFGPLVILLITEDPFVAQNAKNALIWQLLLTVYVLISAILIIVLVGLLLLFVLALLDLVFCIIAAVKASEGEAWQYPLTPAV